MNIGDKVVTPLGTGFVVSGNINTITVEVDGRGQSVFKTEDVIALETTVEELP